MADIQIKLKSEETNTWVFDVTVSEDNDKTIHTVKVEKHDYERLTGGKITPEELVKSSFRFLLEREEKGSILSQFNIMEIAKYFPDYEQEIANF